MILKENPADSQSGVIVAGSGYDGSWPDEFLLVCFYSAGAFERGHKEHESFTAIESMEAVTDGLNCRYSAIGGLDSHVHGEVSL